MYPFSWTPSGRDGASPALAMNEQDRRSVRLTPLAHVRLQAAAGHRVSLHPPVGFCSASVAISRLPVFAVLARWSSSRSRRHRAESLIFRRRAAICPAAGCLRAPFPCLTQRPGQSFTRRINPVQPVGMTAGCGPGVVHVEGCQPADVPNDGAQSGGASAPRSARGSSGQSHF